MAIVRARSANKINKYYYYRQTYRTDMSCYANESCLSPTTGTAPQLFSTALQFFAAAQCLIKTFDPDDACVYNCEEFDYIIVGAGTAGCILANRLSEDKCRTVLLIEAGDSAPLESRVPGLDLTLQTTKYDWTYFTSNDDRSNKANKNGSVHWPRGKMLGGSSSLNVMLYVRGVKHDYDVWYNQGNKEWHYDIVKKYFKKAESFQYLDLLKYPEVSNEYGHYGPLVVNRFNSTVRDPVEDLLNSFEEIGLNRVLDLNLPDNFKSGVFTVTAANGERQSHDIAYLYPIRKKPNLKILKNTLVTKILLDKSNKAHGVIAEHNGKKFKFYAKLEVIICAGSVNSPQLLMLSGIGPKHHLEAKNIKCRVNSPMVGQNLHDHPLTPITIYGKGPSDRDLKSISFGVIEYLYNRTGYLAESAYSAAAAYYSSSRNLTYPEYQIVLGLIWKNSSSTANIASNSLRYKETLASSIVKLNEKNLLFLFQLALLHPMSRGNISLNTSNPRDHPLIYPNYFLNSEDLDSAADGIRTFTKIVYTTFFRSIDAFLGRMEWPACDKYELDSVDYWKCICINVVSSYYHPVGTCKMGPNPDTSVVDSRLRVHGVSNLRVIDASIIPNITSGNTNGPTTMIGERGADLVKEDHQRC